MQSAPDEGSVSADTNPSPVSNELRSFRSTLSHKGRGFEQRGNQASRTMWPDRRIIDLFKTEFPIVLAPMAGIMDAELVIAAAQGGALGSLPCAMITAEKAREQVNIIRQRVSGPVNMNFFCHTAVDADPAREAGWKARLGAYYKELGID